MWQRETIQILLLLPLFFTVEFTRAALWTARAVDEPDSDGPLLRALFAFLVGALSMVPKPVLTLVMYIAWIASIPFRSLLWLWGIGREHVRKPYPGAVTNWYDRTRTPRAKMMLRKRLKEEGD